MWVSGSLIRSSTWRSSSVSAPCISSSMSLPSSADEIAHDARQLLPGIADRLHARLHDAFLQLGGDVGEPLQRHLEFGFVVAAHDVEQLVAGQHQLRDHGHQVFERVDVDADRLVGDLGLGVVLVVGRVGAVFGSASARRRRGLAARRPGPASRGTRARVRRARLRPGAAAAPASAAPACRPRASARRRLRRFAPALRHALELADQVACRRLPARARSASSSSSMSLIRSMVDRISVTASPVTGMPSRNLPISVSAACASASSRGRPRKPQVPLMVWTRRKMLSRIFGVVRLLLEAHELDVDHVEALVRLGQELAQQVVHRQRPSSPGTQAARPLPFGSRLSVLRRRLISVARAAIREAINDAVNAAR